MSPPICVRVIILRTDHISKGTVVVGYLKGKLEPNKMEKRVQLGYQEKPGNAYPR